MVDDLVHWFIKKYILAKWRRRKRRKKNISFKIAGLKGVFQKLEQYKIKYAVLRWFDEVPLTVDDERRFGSSNDIDLLINTEDLDILASIVSRHIGNIRCDVYSVTGRRGMSYAGMPYYPPTLASVVLNNTIRYRDSFNVPEALTYFRSLAFHLVYHKGLACGIPSGCHLKSDSNPKRPYGQLLANLGNSLNLSIEKPYTLLGLHGYLKQCNWSMPYDLLERWPQQTDWHKELLKREADILQPWADKLPGLLVFFIRRDLVEGDKTKIVYEMLEEKFAILKKENLNQDQVDRVIRQVRGGNWIAHNDKIDIAPAIAVICYDYNPVAIQETDEDRVRRYPLVRNKNVFHKHEIRSRLEKMSKVSEEVFGIHGSDNAYESQHMIHVLYGEKALEVNHEIYEIIQRKNVRAGTTSAAL